MVKRTFLLLTILCLAAGICWADASEDYNFISADALKDRIDAKSPVTIVDICPVEQFATGHIKGAIETNAYPVKTQAERDKLAKLLPGIKASKDDVVIICPRGAGGAKRTYDFYKAQGVKEDRLLILEKGMNGWPYHAEKK
jgi:rhodanese-related sulfurtransferase